MNKDEVTFVIIGLESGFLGETDQRRCVNNALLGSTFQIFLVEGQASFIIIEPGPLRCMHQCEKNKSAMVTEPSDATKNHAGMSVRKDD